jgi:hypothetical protein
MRAGRRSKDRRLGGNADLSGTALRYTLLLSIFPYIVYIPNDDDAPIIYNDPLNDVSPFTPLDDAGRC